MRYNVVTFLESLFQSAADTTAHDPVSASSSGTTPPGTPGDRDRTSATSQPHHAAAPTGREWDTEAKDLIAFYQSARPQLPRMPFWLTRWQFISDPAKWYQALDSDISFGPLFCRARMGALQEDLRLLQEYVVR